MGLALRLHMKLRLKTLTLLMGIVALSAGAIALNSFNPTSEIDHASVTPVDAASDPWASLDYSSYGVSFRNSLAKLIKQTGNKTISYNSNNEVLKKSDASPTHSGAVVPFYHRDTDYTTSWNKEHTWPNSRGAGKSGPGSDPHMLRPTLSSENSSRGNSFYGTGSREWDPASLGFEGARGEAARIIFYVATKYYDTHSTSGTSKATQDLNLSNNPNDSTSKGSMGTLKYLVQWNNEYPVTESEIRRNNYLDSAGFGRNPFIDNPDLANYIYDVNGLRTTPYAGGNTDPDSVYLTLSPSEFSLPVNSSQTINVTLRNAEPSTLVWYAQDSGIVSVTPTGDKSSATVTGLSAGETKVFCYSTDDESAVVSANVKVYDPSVSVGGETYIELDKDSLNVGTYSSTDTTVEVGGVEFSYVEVGNYSGDLQFHKGDSELWNVANNGHIEKIVVTYNKGADGMDVYFGNSVKPNTSKATVSASSDVYTYTPTQPYYDYFMIKNNGSSVSNAEKIEIYYAEAENVDVSSVTIPQDSVSLEIGGTASVNANVLPSNATDKSLTYSSSDNRVVSVSSSGVLTGLMEGKATVTATSVSNPNASASVEVTVLPAKEEGGYKLSISPSEWEMSEGSSLSLHVTTEPELDEGGSIYYSSSDTKVATVSQDGVVTAIKEGRATISARIVGTNDMASMDLTVTFNPNLDKEVAAFDLSFNGKGISGDGSSLTIPASSSASFVLEEPKDLLTITGSAEVEVYAGESEDSLSKIEKDGDSYPVSGKTHFRLSNASSSPITITGISLSVKDAGSTPNPIAGCYGSIGGSIAASVIVLMAISALVVVRRKKNRA